MIFNSTIQTEILYNDPDGADRHRIMELPSGNKVHFKAEDPFGFVRINFDKGPTPEYLSGQYTSFQEAEKAIEAHLRRREYNAELALENQRPKKVKLTPRIPVNEPNDDSGNGS